MNNSLTKRQQKLLKLLFRSSEFLSSSYLAEKTGVSDRTVRSDLEIIKYYLKPFNAEVLSERGKGYFLPKQLPKELKLIVEQDEEIFNDDICNILLMLLDSKNAVDLEDMCDELYVSRSTLDRRLKDISRILSVWGIKLELVRLNQTVALAGSEREKRTLFNLVVTRTKAGLSLNISSYEQFFEPGVINNIKDIVIDELNNKKLILPDLGIIGVTLHIAIALKRAQMGCYIAKNDEKIKSSLVGRSEWNVAVDVLKKVGDMYGINFNINEVEDVASRISYRRVFITEGLSKDELFENVDKFYLNIVDSILYEIKKEFLLDLTNDEELFIGLAYHLKTLSGRYGIIHDIRYLNPLLDDIRDKYPFVFELAVFARQRLIKMMGFELFENEISYIALYLGAAIEKLKHMDRRLTLKVAVVCHTGYSNSRFLTAKLESMFSDSIDILGPYSSLNYEKIISENPDIILTTTELDENAFNVPVVSVVPLLDKNDVIKLKKIFFKLSKKQSSKNFSYEDFFDKNYFYPGMELSDREEIITYMANRLSEGGVVFHNFLDLTFEREKLSTTVMQNGIAFPHPIEPCAFRSVISVATLKKPVIWHERSVSIVFLMAIKKGDQKYLRDFYELTVDLSDDCMLVERLISALNYNDFMKIINEKGNLYGAN